uniref:Uma2 family endonuclease n=1 Tax=Thermus islandicus TaxID=540988 RepID=A0A7C2GGZ0_9DEIN
MALKGKAWNWEAYLVLEETSQEKINLVQGGLLAMAGAGRKESRLLTRLLLLLAPACLEARCEAYVADMRLKVGEDVFYRDLIVVCEPSSDPRYEEHPCLVVEILSKSTEAMNRGRKLRSYLRLPSLKVYLLLDSRERRVEGHFQEGESWVYRELAEVALACPPVRFSLGEVYEGVL